MIHDYKFDRKLRDRTYKPRTRTPLYIGALVIVGALAALGMRDTGAVIPPQDPVMAAPVSTLLSKKAEPELVSLPLAIPGQQPPSLDSVTPAGSDAQAVQADQNQVDGGQFVGNIHRKKLTHRVMHDPVKWKGRGFPRPFSLRFIGED